MQPPSDASINVQNAFRELEKRIKSLEALVGYVRSLTNVPENIEALNKEIEWLNSRSKSLSELDVFRASGPAHALGHVPDPGFTADTERVLLENGKWGYPARGQLRAAPEDTSLPSLTTIVKGPLAVSGPLSAAGIETTDLKTHGQVQFRDSFWDDLKFPAGGFNPAGSTAPPAQNTATGLLDFSGTVDNIIGGVAQFPHAWQQGTTISPHIHLRFPTSAAANTRWKFEYDIANINGNFTNNSGTYTDGGTITVANPQNVKKHVIAEFTDIAMTGFTMSCQMVWKLTRLAASDAADNDTSVCELLEFDIHYQIDSIGSNDEYTK